MSSDANNTAERAGGDAKEEESGRHPGQESHTARLLRENVVAREALANQLSANAAFQVPPGQPSALNALQMLRQGGTGVLGSNPGLSNFGSGPAFMAGLHTQSLESLIGTATAANLREARLRLLLHQQQQLQLNQHLLQQQQLSHIQQQQQQQQQQQVQNQNLLANIGVARMGGTESSHSSLSNSTGLQASTNLTAQLAMRGLGALGGIASDRAFNIHLGGEANSLPNLIAGSPMTSLPSLRPAQPQQAAAVTAFSESAAGAGIARMPEAQGQPTEDDQPEMKDAEYFELFGFNDEDGVQIINETFPHKLYRMLYEVEKNMKEDIVSFFSHGKAFIVHQPKRFVEEIMPKYFSTSRMSSFQRQLNLYGFQRIDDGPEKGGFVHQFFQKGKRSLCNKIKRQKNRTQATASSVQPDVQVGAGRGSPQAVMQRGFAARGAAAAAGAQMSQNQQAQILLQRMLNQQEQQNRDAAGKSPR